MTPGRNQGIQLIIKKYRASYKKIGTVFCPAINETVSFNSQGFNHLIFKNGHRRTDKVIRSRMVLIPLAKPALKNGGHNATMRKKIEIVDGRKVEVTYLAVEAMVGKNKTTKVRVVIRKVGGCGKYCFHSIMRRK